MAVTVGAMPPKTLLMILVVMAITVGLILAASRAPTRRPVGWRSARVRAGTPGFADRTHRVRTRTALPRTGPSHCADFEYRDKNTRPWLHRRSGVKRVDGE
jgi:hypothetical protein